MTDNELKIYMKKRQQQFADPEILLAFEGLVNEILKITQFTIVQKMTVFVALEFLCFAIHTDDGRKMYLKLLNHVAPHCPDIAQKYWAIFDRQESMIERYRFPEVEYEP
jgi:hypothetical protein